MSADSSDNSIFDRLWSVLFVLSLCVVVFAYGYCAHKFKWFPHSFITDAMKGAVQVEEIVKDKKPWFYIPIEGSRKILVHDETKTFKGLSLTTSIAEDRRMFIRIIDMAGEPVQEWKVSWRELWPDATHVPKMFLPKEEPGTHIHGAVLMDNGDVVFNFEHLGLMRLNPCGDVVWRLPYRTHHSIHRDEAGDLWVSAQINRDAAPVPEHGNYKTPYIEPMILKVSPEGEVLLEKSVISLLQENDLRSLLYMTTSNELVMEATGDTLHLNDIEVFPSTLTPGVFSEGDVMISLRNINTILVFDPINWKVKHKSLGHFVRQHDPDFIDGNTISIYDNNNVNLHGIGRYSRILLESVDTQQTKVHFTGSAEKRFFSLMMGKHQWLPNGNVLITDSMAGRAIEVDSRGDIVWEYINNVGNGYAGIVEEVTRLSDQYTPAFFEAQREKCAAH